MRESTGEGVALPLAPPPMLPEGEFECLVEGEGSAQGEGDALAVPRALPLERALPLGESEAEGEGVGDSVALVTLLTVLEGEAPALREAPPPSDGDAAAGLPEGLPESSGEALTLALLASDAVGEGDSVAVLVALPPVGVTEAVVLGEPEATAVCVAGSVALDVALRTAEGEAESLALPVSVTLGVGEAEGDTERVPPCWPPKSVDEGTAETEGAEEVEGTCEGDARGEALGVPVGVDGAELVAVTVGVALAGAVALPGADTVGVPVTVGDALASAVGEPEMETVRVAPSPPRLAVGCPGDGDTDGEDDTEGESESDGEAEGEYVALGHADTETDAASVAVTDTVPLEHADGVGVTLEGPEPEATTVSVGEDEMKNTVPVAAAEEVLTREGDTLPEAERVRSTIVSVGDSEGVSDADSEGDCEGLADCVALASAGEGDCVAHALVDAEGLPEALPAPPLEDAVLDAVAQALGEDRKPNLSPLGVETCEKLTVEHTVEVSEKVLESEAREEMEGVAPPDGDTLALGVAVPLRE